MEHILSRSAVCCNPAGGLLLAEHFQMAYVTTDMERALDLFPACRAAGDDRGAARAQ
jgi:hypothetical protein